VEETFITSTRGAKIMERPPGNVLVILRQNVRLVSQLMIQAFAF
jgi:hypothetical protein